MKASKLQMLFAQFFKDTAESLWFERTVCLMQCTRMMLVQIVISEVHCLSSVALA